MNRVVTFTGSLYNVRSEYERFLQNENIEIICTSLVQEVNKFNSDIEFVLLVTFKRLK